MNEESILKELREIKELLIKKEKPKEIKSKEYERNLP